MDAEAPPSSLGGVIYILIWVLVVVVIAIVHYLAWLKNGKKGPYCFPYFGCAWQFYRNSERIHEYKAEHLSKSGGTMQLYVYGHETTYVADPWTVEYMLKTNLSSFEKGEADKKRLEPLLGHGISNCDGLDWVKQRKCLAQHIVSPKFRTYRTKCYQRKAETFAKILAEHHDGQLTVDIQALCVRLALDTSCQVACGKDAASLAPSLPASEMAHALALAAAAQAKREDPNPFQQLNECLGLGSSFSIRNAAKVIRKFVAEAVQERKKQIKAPGEEEDYSLVSTMLMGEEGQEGVDNVKETERLTEAAVNLIVASQAPIASALSWVFYELACHPDVDEQLFQEIRRVTRSAGDDATSGVDVEALAKRVGSETVSPLRMPYMHAVISESLRLHPPVPETCRHATQKSTFPDGTELNSARVVISSFAMGHAEAVWGSDVSQFQPSRWIFDGKFREETPFKFPIFHAGPRMCLGRDIAYLQMKIVLTTVLSKFRVQLVAGQTITAGPSSILYFKDGLEVTVEER